MTEAQLGKFDALILSLDRGDESVLKELAGYANRLGFSGLAETTPEELLKLLKTAPFSTLLRIVRLLSLEDLRIMKEDALKIEGL